jgi:hypothetical protein
MYVFIDDSGDAGFKLDRGSSEHLVIVCCVFDSADDVEITADLIRAFRASIKWNPPAGVQILQDQKDPESRLFQGCAAWQVLYSRSRYRQENSDKCQIQNGQRFLLQLRHPGSIDQLIQLADMMAGAIRRWHDTDHQNQETYRLAVNPFVRRASSDVWLFGK